MGKRQNIEGVKRYFSEYNCKLLESTYKDCDTTMNFLCSCGRIGKTTFRSFKRSKYHVCRECLNEIASERNKKDITVVSNFFKDNGCKLLEKQYISNDTHMLFECKCGRKHSDPIIVFDSF